jgi:hypothetical protein
MRIRPRKENKRYETELHAAKRRESVFESPTEF